MSIMNFKRKISEVIGMDVIYIIDVYLDIEDILYFTVLSKDKFSVYLDQNGNIEEGSLRHIKTYEELESIPF